MASEDFKLDEWLSEVAKDTELTAEDRGTLLSLMSKKGVPDKLRGSVLKEADYRRKTQGLAEERKAFESERQSIEDQKVALEKWRNDVQAQLDTYVDKYEKSALTASQYEAKIRMIAERNGLKVEDLLGGELPPTVQPTKGPASDIDVSKFVTREDFDSASGKFNAVSVLSQAKIADLAEEYASLTGKSIREAEFTVKGPQGRGTQVVKGRAGLAQAALESGKGLDEFFREHFKIADLERSKWEAEIRKDQADKSEREFRAKFGEEGERRPTFPEDGVPQNPAQKLIMGHDKPPATREPQAGVPAPARDRVANALRMHRERVAAGTAWKD